MSNIICHLTSIIYHVTNIVYHFINILGRVRVDCKTIATQLLCNLDPTNARKLVEFVLSRAACGRGGEHLWLRFNEATYDPFLNCVDFEWHIAKQCDSQMMLIFCDKKDHCLCVYFCFGVYWLYGGLERYGLAKHIQDFAFPYLFRMQKTNVARRLTHVIRDNIDVSSLTPEQGEQLRSGFTSRSPRRGIMTENRVHSDLTMYEEYARSGHSVNTRNVNVDAEGYIEQTPALNAPGGLAAAGYTNCHSVPAHFRFDAVGHAPALIALVCEKFFLVEHPLFFPGGRLYPMVEMCAARVIAAFNDLESTYGPDHVLVKMILHRFIVLEIDDARVPNRGGHRAHEVLSYWSTAISEEFQNNNNRRLVSTNSGTNTALSTNTALNALTDTVLYVAKKQGTMEQRMAELVLGQDSLSNAAALVEENAKLVMKMQKIEERKEQYKKEIVMLRKKLQHSQLVMTPEAPEAGGANKRKYEEDKAPKPSRGESLKSVRVLHDVNNFDRLEASNRIQQWQEEVRYLQLFKSFVLDAMQVVVTSADCGPIPILIDGQMVDLTKDNLDVLANIVDPICGPQQFDRLIRRMTNPTSHTFPPNITGLFVTLADQGRVLSSPPGMTVFESTANLSVMASKDDPIGVASLLRDGHNTLTAHAGGLKLAQPARIQTSFLKTLGTEGTPGKAKNKTSRGVTLVAELTRLYKKGAFKGDAIDLDKSMFHLDTHARYIGIPDDFSERSLYTKAMTCLAMGITIPQFVNLCDETLEEKALKELVWEIAEEVKAKMASLEIVYLIRDKDKKDTFGDGVNAYGRRLTSLKKAMAVQLKGDVNAQRKIDEHSGVHAASGAASMVQKSVVDFFGNGK